MPPAPGPGGIPLMAADPAPAEPAAGIWASAALCPINKPLTASATTKDVLGIGFPRGGRMQTLISRALFQSAKIRGSFPVGFQTVAQILAGYPFTGLVHHPGLQHRRGAWPMQIHPCRDLRFRHALASANPRRHLAGERLDIRVCVWPNHPAALCSRRIERQGITPCTDAQIMALPTRCGNYPPWIAKPIVSTSIRSVTARASAGRTIGEGTGGSGRCDRGTGLRGTSIRPARACAGRGRDRSGWPADRRRCRRFRAGRSRP
jgi:hypothetical protein